MPETSTTKRILVGWFAGSFVGRSASGTAYVARMTIQALIELPERYQVVIFARNEYELSLAKNDPLLNRATIKLMPKVKFPKLNTSIQYYKMTRKSEYYVDVLHFSVARLYPFFWKFPAKKFFCTFHAGGDVTVKANRFLFSKNIYNFVAKSSWRKLDAIIAVSEFGRSEIANSYKIPKSAIRVIPNGIDGFTDEPEVPLKLPSGAKQIIVVIGRWQEYKNVHTAVNAISNSKMMESGNCYLVTVGNSFTKDNKMVMNELEQIPQERRQHFNYLEPGEMVWLYRKAKVVIHPSLNEGFGLPAFEASLEGANLIIHHGTPADAILSRIEGVFACNMEKSAEIGAALEKALSLPRKNYYERLIFFRDNRLLWADFKRRYQDLYLEQTNY